MRADVSGTALSGAAPAGIGIIVKGLILAQNERWRRGLGMQVERVPRKGESGERDSNT